MIGVLLIGAGRIARSHAIAIAAHPDAMMVGVVDQDLLAAKRFAAEFDIPVATVDLGQALDSDRVHAVVVAAPTHLHHNIALTAIGKGKHTLVEKPFAVNVAEAREMVAAAAKAEVCLMSGQVLRFMPTFAWARDFVAAGNLGKPLHVIERRLVYRTENFPWWQNLPNFLISHWGSHSIDIVLDMLSEEAIRVYCDASSVGENRNVVDDFDLYMRLRSGARASFHMSFASRRTIHDLVVIGEDSTLEFDGYRSIYCNDSEIFTGGEADMLSQAFEAQMQNFIGAIRGDCDLRSSGTSVLPTYAVVDAAEDSLARMSVVNVRRY